MMMMMMMMVMMMLMMMMTMVGIEEPTHHYSRFGRQD